MRRNLMKKVVFLVVAVLLVSLVVLGGCAQPAAPGAPGETTKTVTTTVTAAAKTVTAPAKTVTTTKTVTAGVEEPKVIEWTMSASMPEVEPYGYWANPGALNHYMLHNACDRGWKEWVEAATGGRLHINMVEPNSVFPVSESIENIGGGTIQAAFTSTGWIAGTVPESYILVGLSMMWPDARYAWDCFYNYGLLEKALPAYETHNVHFIPVANSEIGGMITTFPCTDMASMKDKKIRFFGGHGEFVKAIGASPIALPYGDVYLGMKLGTIDGATTGALAIQDIKLKEVAMGMATMQLYGCSVNCQLFNMDAVSALPDDIKHIILEESKWYHGGSVGLVELIHQEFGMSKAKKEEGFQQWNWPAEDILQARKLASEEVWPAFGEKTALSKELLDIIVEYQKVLGLLD
jgi:TRAP-type C4-dicarboxylate transport system substrate-binding protein